ncbi:MAG: hypothetical protein ACRECH_09720, partial [Nitrososphaerales archaeon]
GVTGVLASLTPSHGHEPSMTLFDVATLKLITSLSKKPVFYPTQGSIRPEDVQILSEQGCKGLLVSTSTYGSTIETCKERISSFRRAINQTYQTRAP